jgi:hypothetical protein
MSRWRRADGNCGLIYGRNKAMVLVLRSVANLEVAARFAAQVDDIMREVTERCSFDA